MMLLDETEAREIVHETNTEATQTLWDENWKNESIAASRSSGRASSNSSNIWCCLIMTYIFLRFQIKWDSFFIDVKFNENLSARWGFLCFLNQSQEVSSQFSFPIQITFELSFFALWNCNQKSNDVNKHLGKKNDIDVIEV